MGGEVSAAQIEVQAGGDADVAKASHAVAAGALLDAGVEDVFQRSVILAIGVLLQGVLQNIGHIVQNDISGEVDVAHVPAGPADGGQEGGIGNLQVDAVLPHAPLVHSLHVILGEVIDDVPDGGLDHDLDGVGVQHAVNGDILAVDHHEIGGVHLHVDMGDLAVAEVKVHIGKLAVGPDIVGLLAVRLLDAGLLAQRRGAVCALGKRGDAQQCAENQRDCQPSVELFHNTHSLSFLHVLQSGMGSFFTQRRMILIIT